MGRAQRSSGAWDWSEMALSIDTEARHVGCRCGVGVGRVQHVQQAIVKGQADGTRTSGREDAYQVQLTIVHVDDRDLVAAGVDREQPLPVRGADQGSLCAIREGGQAAEATDRSRTQL